MITPKLDFDIDLSTEKILKMKPNFKRANDVKKKLAYDFTENECTEDEKEDEKDEKEEWCIDYSEVSPNATQESVLNNGKQKFLKYMKVSPSTHNDTIEYENITN